MHKVHPAVLNFVLHNRILVLIVNVPMAFHSDFREHGVNPGPKAEEAIPEPILWEDMWSLVSVTCVLARPGFFTLGFFPLRTL